MIVLFAMFTVSRVQPLIIRFQRRPFEWATSFSKQVKLTCQPEYCCVCVCVCHFILSNLMFDCFFYTYLLLKFIHAFALYDARSFILNECFCHAAHRGRWQLLSVETVSTSNYIAECGGTMNICNIKVWQSECMISLCIIGKVWRQQNGPKSMGQWGNGAGSRDRCQTRRSTHWTMYIRPWCRSASGRREHSSTP